MNEMDLVNKMMAFFKIGLCIACVFSALFILAALVSAIYLLCDLRKTKIEKENLLLKTHHKSCVGCKNYLGGGYCRINLEAECGAGEFEMYEEEESESQ